MTKNQFLKLAENFADYARAEVSFKYWFPSTNDYRPGKGILLGFDLGSETCPCLIIGHMGHRIALYYEYVDYPKTKTTR